MSELNNGKLISAAGTLLAALPVVSFAAQYYLDQHSSRMLYKHLTVTYVDWIFVPFNLLVVHIIDWRRGGLLFVITVIAVISNATSHAMWQYYLVEHGHMFTADHGMLPAGWVHLMFSTLQMILLIAFILNRRENPKFLFATSALAFLYFITMGVCGYLMNHTLIATDVLTVSIGVGSLLIFPWLISKSSSTNAVHPVKKESR